MVADHISYISFDISKAAQDKRAVLWSPYSVNVLKTVSPNVTLHSLTSALAGQTASNLGEKNPAVETGINDNFPNLFFLRPDVFL